MQTNRFENSRISEGTMLPGAQHVSGVPSMPEETSQHEPGKGFADTAPPDPDAKKPMGRVLSARTITGYRVRNSAGEDLGRIEEIMIDLTAGRVAYAVLSYGGFLGIGDRLLMVPWSALTIDRTAHEFVLGVGREDLERAPSFERSHWPDPADPVYAQEIHRYYGQTPYREGAMTEIRRRPAGRDESRYSS